MCLQMAVGYSAWTSNMTIWKMLWSKHNFGRLIFGENEKQFAECLEWLAVVVASGSTQAKKSAKYGHNRLCILAVISKTTCKVIIHFRKKSTLLLLSYIFWFYHNTCSITVSDCHLWISDNVLRFVLSLQWHASRSMWRNVWRLVSKNDIYKWWSFVKISSKRQFQRYVIYAKVSFFWDPSQDEDMSSSGFPPKNRP